MFRTVHVPLDGSLRAATALGPASEVARRTGAELVLVTVTSPGLSTLDDELLLKRAAATLRDVPYRCEVLESNDVGAALAAATGAADGALVCMATHGRTGLARVAIGSIAESIVRAVTCPTLLVGPAVRPGSWSVVQACVDTTSELSRRAVPVAAELATTLGARLWLTEVHPARRLESSDVLDAGALAAIAEPLRRDGLDVEWEVFHGDDAVAELLRAQANVGSSVLVTSTHARRGIARAALGSVTMALAHRAPCPVLVVPPVDRG